MTPGRPRPDLHDTWPALGSWQVQLTKGSVRIGDVDRDRAARALGEHYAAGRLERSEYDERVDAALTARTWGDLAPLFRDLPGPVPSQRAPAVVASPRSGHRRRLTFLPVLLILVGVAMFTGHGWVVWLGLGAFLLLRRARHTSGSWRPPRGSWS